MPRPKRPASPETDDAPKKQQKVNSTATVSSLQRSSSQQPNKPLPKADMVEPPSAEKVKESNDGPGPSGQANTIKGGSSVGTKVNKEGPLGDNKGAEEGPAAGDNVGVGSSAGEDARGEGLSDEQGDTGEGPLNLRYARLWSVPHLDAKLETAIAHLNTTRVGLVEEFTWACGLGGNVSTFGLAAFHEKGGGDITTTHGYLRLVNVVDWTVKKRIVYNPIFADTTGVSFQGSYNHLVMGGKTAQFGILGLVTGSSVTIQEGRARIAPLRQQWNAFGTFLATIAKNASPGETEDENEEEKEEENEGPVLSVTTEDNDVVFSRPPYLKVSSSPVKKGRDPPPETAAASLVSYCKRNNGSFDLSSSRTYPSHRELVPGEIVFVTFTVRKHERQETWHWYLTPVQFYVLQV